ncbi:hypothetical protein ACJJTC_012490 [Scirpophaga incertulas]
MGLLVRLASTSATCYLPTIYSVISTNFLAKEQIIKSQVERWFKKFKSGVQTSQIEEGRGRPSNFNDQAQDRSGIIHREIISNGIRYEWNDDDERQQWQIPDKNGKRKLNINSDVYLSQLDRISCCYRTKDRAKRNHILFHHENARPHIERQKNTEAPYKLSRRSIAEKIGSRTKFTTT